LERLKQLEGRQFLTDAEVAELKKRADRLFKSGDNDFPQALLRDDVFRAVWENLEQYKNPNATGDAGEMIQVEFDNRRHRSSSTRPTEEFLLTRQRVRGD
jgi:hypothetical protein